RLCGLARQLVPERCLAGGPRLGGRLRALLPGGAVGLRPPAPSARRRGAFWHAGGAPPPLRLSGPLRLRAGRCGPRPAVRGPLPPPGRRRRLRPPLRGRVAALHGGLLRPGRRGSLVGPLPGRAAAPRRRFALRPLRALLSRSPDRGPPPAPRPAAGGER